MRLCKFFSCSFHLKMDETLRSEDILLQVRDKLNKEGVKLWLPPFYEHKTGPNHIEIENLAKKYSQSLKIAPEICVNAINVLMNNALETLKQRDRFKESGMATVKLKFLNFNPPKTIPKEVLLSMTGSDLVEQLVEDNEAQGQRLKLICNGKLIKEDEILSQQGVNNGNQILVLVLSQSVTNLRENELQQKDLEATKADASLLANDNSYMQLEDQHGNAIEIPEKERKSLTIAIALHEKGRSALKREDHARALVFFLDADKEFSQCNSQLLQCVDNYALLDLDIAWCYLCLQSIAHLPEAYQRLKRCEESFQKTYGTNLERLIAVKGSSGNESALFMRLHLMQGIVLYHQNRREEALRLFEKCQMELAPLRVDNDKLIALIELGYSLPEARIGLRATRGDVNAAANYINENRTKRSESRKKAMAEKILQKEKIKLGKCVDGKQYVEPKFLKLLVNMGYAKESARRALQQSNNIISDSIQYIQEHPHAGPSNSRSQEFLTFIEELIPELVAAGFDAGMARAALKKHEGDIIKAADELLTNNGLIDGDLSDLLSESERDDRENTQLKEEAWSRLSKDISIVDDDHLDLTLEKEEEFLNQYMILLLQ